jgi:hypothetical protein
VETLTVTEVVDEPLMFSGFGVTEQAEFTGTPAQVKLTVPLNPFVPLTLRV